MLPSFLNEAHYRQLWDPKKVPCFNYLNKDVVNTSKVFLCCSNLGGKLGITKAGFNSKI
jgi:hypothetical protein